MSPNYDCALTFVSGTDLFTISINSTDSTTGNAVSLWAQVVTSTDRSAAQVLSAHNAGNLAVGPGCWAVRVESLIYVRNAGATAFGNKLAALTGSVVYDKTLKFAYLTNKIYKYTTSDYAEIITGVTGLKSTVELYASSD